MSELSTHFWPDKNMTNALFSDEYFDAWNTSECNKVEHFDLLPVHQVDKAQRIPIRTHTHTQPKKQQILLSKTFGNKRGKNDALS